MFLPEVSKNWTQVCLKFGHPATKDYGQQTTDNGLSYLCSRKKKGPPNPL